MRVTDLPANDRPRERLLTHGAEALSDRELLALIIGSGTLGSDAIDLAARVIEKSGDLSQLARADPHTLLGLAGMGPAKAARVAAAFQLARRAESEVAPRWAGSSAGLAAVAAPLLRGLRAERVVVVSCDQGGKVLRTIRLTEGVSDRSLMPVRDVLAAALSAGAASFGVAHNHPSGTLEPSEADRRATARLREGAEAVGLRFLGHVIVTDRQWRPVRC
jgi:DNA repair protein RadC